MFKALQIILNIILHPESITSGVSYDNGILLHCIVRRKDNHSELLSCTDNVPWWYSFFTPVVVHADLDGSPVLMLKEEIGDSDPDIWIDLNEERIIPKGFLSDSIVNEYTVNNSEILSASVTVRDRDTAKQERVSIDKLADYFQNKLA